MRILYLLYDIIIHIALVISLPYFLYKMITVGKYGSGIPERFGFLSKEKLNALKGGEKTVWFHAVSVGETKAALVLLKLYKKKYPSHKILFSTVTITGNAIAKKEGAGLIDALIYMPFDYSWVIRRVKSKINPAAFIVVEKEYWPNITRILSEDNVPIIIVNGTMSERSFGRYKFFGFLFNRVFSSFAFFCAQTAEDEKRALLLGVKNGRTRVTGNLKFDMAPSGAVSSKIEELRKSFCFKDNETIIVAGSTHEGEEEALIRVLKLLKQDLRNLKMIIAPRHPERFEDVEKMAANSGLKYVRRTKSGGEADIAMLDTIGELSAAYGLSTIAFVGGSISPIGGHNILEPIFFSKPVVYGKHVKNYAELAGILEEKGAAFMAHDEDELLSIFRKLLLDEKLRKDAGSAGRAFADENSGTGARTLECVEKILDEAEQSKR